MSARLAILITTLAVVTASPRAGAAQDVRAASPLRVGAAKVDVTPADSALPKNYLGRARPPVRARDRAGERRRTRRADHRRCRNALRCDLAGRDTSGRNGAWDSVGERAVDGDAYAQRARTAGGPTTQRRSWTPCGARSRS